MATARLVQDRDAGPEVSAVFADIRATRQTDRVNNFWRALANEPALLVATWERLKRVMGPTEGLDPKVKEMVYLAVSVANGCSYCVHSHTAAARGRGMTPAEHADLLAVIAMAAETNALATALGVPVDPAFEAEDAALAADGAGGPA